MNVIKSTYTNPELEQWYRSEGYWADKLLTDYLSEAAAKFPEREVAVDNSGKRLTFGGLLAQASSLAYSLNRMGIVQGDIVSFQLPNWVETLVVWYGILLAGATANPIISIYRSKEVKYILNSCESKAVFVPVEFRRHNYLTMLKEIKRELLHLEHIITVRDQADGIVAFEDLTKNPVENFAFPNLDPDDNVLVLFTSGTTADPKGTLHSHNTLGYENQNHLIKYFELKHDEVIFMPSPLTHITGVNCGMILPIYLGCKVVLLDAWNPEKALELIEQEHCTFLMGATTFFDTMYRSPQWKVRDTSTLRHLLCGGADIPPVLMQNIQAELPNAVVARMYGLSELPSATCSENNVPIEKRLQTEGKFMFPSQGRIVDQDEHPEKVGGVGEIQVQGPDLFRGYLQSSLNADTFTADGWFKTGDLAVIDPEGYIQIKGRKKDIIIRGGENISAKEVEDLLYTHASIREVAIVAMPDEILGEKVCAFVVPMAGDSITLADLVQFLKQKGVAMQKIPERIEIASELPYNASGKIQKHVLRALIKELLEAKNIKAD